MLTLRAFRDHNEMLGTLGEYATAIVLIMRLDIQDHAILTTDALDSIPNLVVNAALPNNHRWELCTAITGRA